MELVKETTEAKVKFHDRYWKNVSQEGELVGLFLVLFNLHDVAAKDFILSLINPDPSTRLTTEEALKHEVCPSFLPVIFLSN